MSSVVHGCDEHGSRARDLLEVEGISSGYGRRIVLRNVSLEVPQGRMVGVIGHNGAGKSTLLKTIVGLVRVRSGDVRLDGQSVAGRSAQEIAGQGAAFVASEDYVFGEMTVEENLALAHRGRSAERAAERASRMLEVFELFPILRERRHQTAATMSGGQQRMLGLALAMMRRPKFYLLDEPSLGLAPRVVEEMFALLKTEIGGRRCGVLLVEQNVRQTLDLVDWVYVMRAGEIILSEDPATLRNRPSLWELF